MAAKFFNTKARVNADGSISVVVPDTQMKKNPRIVKRAKNVAAGWVDATGFHPIRRSPDYDPDRAGDDYGSKTDNTGLKYKRGSKPKPVAKKAKKKTTKK